MIYDTDIYFKIMNFKQMLAAQEVSPNWNEYVLHNIRCILHGNGNGNAVKGNSLLSVVVF